MPPERTKGEKTVIKCESDKGTVVVWDPTDETVSSVDILHRSAERHYKFPLVFGFVAANAFT